MEANDVSRDGLLAQLAASDASRRQATGATPSRVGSPNTFEEYVSDSQALCIVLAEHYGTTSRLRSIKPNRKMGDHTGDTSWEGDITLGNEVIPTIELDADVRSAGDLPGHAGLRAVFGNYKVQAHEVSHTVNPHDEKGYAAPGGLVLEEGLAEEVAHVIAAESLRGHRRTDVLAWYRDNPYDDKVVGSYTRQRHAIRSLLDHIGIPPQAREQLIFDLKFDIDPTRRIEYLTDLSAQYVNPLTPEEIIEVLEREYPEPDYPVPILRPHIQDIAVARSAISIDGFHVSNGTWVTLGLRGAFGRRRPTDGVVLNVDVQQDIPVLEVKDLRGEVHYDLAPSDIEHVLSGPDPTTFTTNDHRYVCGDDVDFVDQLGQCQGATITQVLSAGHDQSPWAAEVLTDAGQPAILTPSCTGSLAPR